MRRYGHKRLRIFPCLSREAWLFALPLALWSGPVTVGAQAPAEDGLARQVQQLTAAMARTQAQLQESQRELDAMRAQLAALQARMATSSTTPMTSSPGTASVPSGAASETQQSTTDALQDLRERQAMLQSQVATHDQTKVESASRYPVKITGLLLFNGFVNTQAVDVPSTPTMAVGGRGSTGASVRQTILGVDATGPTLFGARSYADLRVDFEGNAQNSGPAAAYTGYYSGSEGLLRLRTAHAGLEWARTSAYFSLDRPIISPDSPTSLAASAVPALAWSGNLWTWNPQIGITHDIPFTGSNSLRLQAALLDVGEAPASSLEALTSNASVVSPTSAEQSRWPGVEARVALLGSTTHDDSNHVGVGGYFAQHVIPLTGRRFDAWAVTADARLHLPLRLQLTSSAYRGLGLGGLGGGAFKDFVARENMRMTAYYSRPLEDAGGWAELKERYSERIELNAAFGMDNVFARELRPYASSAAGSYFNLARNRTYTGNVIYSPSAYLLFSIEYRHLNSFPVVGLPSQSNVIGVAAGYKF